MKYVRAATLYLALTSCSHPSKPPCTEESVSALRALYKHAARDVIESGACDKVKDVTECDAYRILELHFEVASKAMCT